MNICGRVAHDGRACDTGLFVKQFSCRRPVFKRALSPFRQVTSFTPLHP